MTYKVYKSFLFNEIRDGDILAKLESLDKGTRSQFVRDALRAYMITQGDSASDAITLSDLMSGINGLSNQISNIKTVSEKPPDDKEPEDIEDIVEKLKSYGDF